MWLRFVFPTLSLWSVCLVGYGIRGLVEPIMLCQKPPQKPGCDDITGEPLEVRDDDKPATVQNRLKIYHETTGEVALFYADLAARDKAVDFFK